jgi:hypothetical protein
MDLKDLIVTPFFLILIYFVAFRYRRTIQDEEQKKFFIPAITFKIIGAIFLGLIYQFYYGGGDTLNFSNLSSIHIYHAFYKDPIIAIKLLLSDGSNKSELYPYSSQIFHFSDQSSFLVVKLAAIVGFFCFHTYSVMAIAFGLFSFTGSWAMYIAFCRIYPNLKKYSAYAIFFLPSVFFWGSGLLKDSITFGAVGWIFYSFVNLAIFQRKIILSSLLFITALMLIKIVKIYILLCLIPALIIWLFFHFSYKVQSKIIRLIIKPALIVCSVLMAYFSANIISIDNNRYNLDNLTNTAKTTYDYLTYMSKQEGGAYYSLGTFDNSISGLIAKAPLAINVTLFRPYLWETRNPVMLISALESLAILLFTLFTLFKSGIFKSLKIANSDPFLVFSLIFSLSFAFAVGISTANFGTLVRYKIPMMPFYILFLMVLLDKSKNAKQFAAWKQQNRLTKTPNKSHSK